jgi:hypothetical protein
MAATIAKTFILGIPSHTLRCMFSLQDCLFTLIFSATCVPSREATSLSREGG